MSARSPGFARRLASGLASWIRIGWWGVAAPRLSERRPLVVVQGVIEREGGLLLSLRDDLWGWELPGGTVEPGEQPEQALRREVREETGLEIEILRRVGAYERRGFRPHTALVYLCRARTAALRPGPEVLAVRWWPATALPMGLFPWYRSPIADALSGGEAVERRERQGLSWIGRAMAIDLRQRWRGL